MTYRNYLPVSLIVFSLIFVGSAQAFIGSIAVGLGQSAEFGKIKGPFSADAEIETKDGKFKSNIRYQDEKLLDVVNMGGQTMRTITRYDLKKTYMLIGDGMYIENAIGESDRTPEYEVKQFEVVGEEIVNGQKTRKIKTVHQSKEGKFGGFLWVNDNNVAIKGFMVSDDGKQRQRILFNLTNYKAGQQPRDAFELPANAKLFTMPSFGGMAGMKGMQGAPGSQGNQSGMDQTGIPGESGTLTEEATNAADEGVRQGVTEGVFEESKNTVKKLIDKGFGLFRD